MSGAGSCALDVEVNLFSGTCNSDGGTCDVSGHR
jgi:hypothetical protein